MLSYVGKLVQRYGSGVWEFRNYREVVCITDTSSICNFLVFKNITICIFRGDTRIARTLCWLCKILNIVITALCLDLDCCAFYIEVYDFASRPRSRISSPICLLFKKRMMRLPNTMAMSSDSMMAAAERNEMYSPIRIPGRKTRPTFCAFTTEGINADKNRYIRNFLITLLSCRPCRLLFCSRVKVAMECVLILSIQISVFQIVPDGGNSVPPTWLDSMTGNEGWGVHRHIYRNWLSSLCRRSIPHRCGIGLLPG